MEQAEEKRFSCFSGVIVGRICIYRAEEDDAGGKEKQIKKIVLAVPAFAQSFDCAGHVNLEFARPASREAKCDEAKKMYRNIRIVR